MLFNDEQYKQGIDQIKKVKIKLHENPVMSGVASINQKLAEVQGTMDFVHELLVEAIRNRAKAKILYEQQKTNYNMELDRLAAEDDIVRGQKSADARKAMASTKAASLQLEEHTAHVEFFKADNYFNIVQQTYHHLENSFEALSRQITATQLAAGLGALDASDLKFVNKNKKISIKESEEENV